MCHKEWSPKSHIHFQDDGCLEFGTTYVTFVNMVNPNLIFISKTMDTSYLGQLTLPSEEWSTQIASSFPRRWMPRIWNNLRYLRKNGQPKSHIHFQDDGRLGFGTTYVTFLNGAKK